MANESTKSAKVNGQLSVEEVSEKFNGGRKIIVKTLTACVNNSCLFKNR